MLTKPESFTKADARSVRLTASGLVGLQRGMDRARSGRDVPQRKKREAVRGTSPDEHTPKRPNLKGVGVLSGQGEQQGKY